MTESDLVIGRCAICGTRHTAEQIRLVPDGKRTGWCPKCRDWTGIKR